MIADDKVTEIICVVNEFCKEFDKICFSCP